MAFLLEEGEALRQKKINAATKLKDIVGSTLGPRGNTVIISRKNKDPYATKDGVTVCNNLVLKDPVENSIVQIIKQASNQTAIMAGDGTTTTIILAHAILRAAHTLLVTGVSAVELKYQIERSVENVIALLTDMAVPIKTKEDIANIATIAANGDADIGQLIAYAVDGAGKDGAVIIKETGELQTRLSMIEGFRFDSGYVSPAFINDERKGECRLKNPLILVTDHSPETVQEIVPAAEIAARSKRPFVIISDNISGQALAVMVTNAIRGKEMPEAGAIMACAVKAPRYGEERRQILSDIALDVGATFFTLEKGMTLDKIQLSDLGGAESIEVGRNHTLLVGGEGSRKQVEEKIELLKEQIINTDDLSRCEIIQERITRLASGVAVIHVGGSTDVEVIERKHRIEDALEGVESAQESGILPGGGVAFLRALKILKKNKKETMGEKIVKEAIQAPCKKILQNAGLSSEVVVSKILKSTKNNYGFDVKREKYCDLIESGIIDPLKVSVSALQNACSVSCALIMSNYSIIED